MTTKSPAAPQQFQSHQETIGRYWFVNWIFFIFWFFGLWRTEKSTAFYAVYQVLMHFTLSFLYTLAMCARLFRIDNTAELVAASGMTLTVVALLVKFINLTYFQRVVTDVLRETETFQLTNAVESKLVRQRMRMFSIISVLYYSMANSSILSSFVAAASSRTLPYAGAYPLDWQHDAVAYWLVYGFQVAGMLMLCSTNVMVELFPGFLMFATSVRMEILAGRLAALNGGSTERSLIDCIKLHQSLLSSTMSIEKSFTIAFFVQICFSGTIICSTAFLLTFTSPSDGMYMYYVFFMCSMVTQIYLPCYFGNEIILQSEQLGSGAFRSGWYEMRPPFKRVLTVFLERSKRRSEVTVGKLFPLSLKTFTSIIYFAYRLYAVVSKN